MRYMTQYHRKWDSSRTIYKKQINIKIINMKCAKWGSTLKRMIRFHILGTNVIFEYNYILPNISYFYISRRYIKVIEEMGYILSISSKRKILQGLAVTNENTYI